ncbi:MAG: NAD(P)/FAD-dependent oxidoreductase [Streptosporangiales bacterium]
MRVAVIGAGILGAAVARELAIRGVRVTVLEERYPGYGTSSTSFAWTNSHNKEPDSYHRLNVEGCAEHERLAADAAQTPRWYFPTGNVEWVGDADGQQVLDQRMRRLDGLGYPCRWLGRAQVRELEPDVSLPPGVERVAYFPSEGHVWTNLLLARLLGEARDRGAVLRWPVRVTGVERQRSAVDLAYADGDRERFDRVVSCVGRWTGDLAAACGTHVPLADPTEPGGAAVGLLAYTGPVPVRLSRVLTTPRLNVRPDGGGRLVLQGLDLDATADPAQPPDTESEVTATLTGRLTDVLPSAAPGVVESVRVGQRALPADGLTVAGFAADDERCYLAATHSGVTLGPLLGRLVATEVADGELSPLLDGFRPQRFAGSAGAVAAPARKPGDQ